MEDESILLDNGYRERYGLLTAVAAAVPEDETILITRVGYQYPGNFSAAFLRFFGCAPKSVRGKRN